ncbi:ATP-binding protein [Thaumasiovibrio subtropicus]|uniref:ATP-binding protein n=1 Tax=Thaumasiovibrio subtropicus TaxID=1891207 RepID=UPI000B34AB8D|nr:ATP-binding protein [Thaumasiovibrio subtropicus]
MIRFPHSLLARTLLFTLVAVICAQLIATLIWYSQTKERELQGLEATSVSMANNFASTVTFFQKLPREYRHIVLDQLRNMGGTRFFVSFNEELIAIEAVPETRLKQIAVNAFDRVLDDKLPRVEEIHVEFSSPDTLHILKNDILLSDLPRSWAHYTLSLEPINPPILVVQIKLAAGEWLYIAALLPAPYVTLEDKILTTQQVWFLIVSTLLLLAFTSVMVRQQTRPLRRLARAANALSLDIHQPPLKEEGASELVTATRAFNRMQQRLRRFIDDRERLFSSISHDLKTPITRLRLRAELIDDEVKITKFNRDLDELELMVKAALQCVKDTDLHENLTEINIHQLLENIAEPLNQHRQAVVLPDNVLPSFVGKPLALKRCLTNVIENGVRYGDKVVVSATPDEEHYWITVCDEGPGIPLSQREKVFEPHFRIATDEQGHGLGLGIARSIAHAHGGDLFLDDNLPRGLRVVIKLPRVSLTA